MSRRLLIIDGNGLGHFAQNGRKLSIGPMPVQAIYNFLRSMRANLDLYTGYEPLILWDGMSWRKRAFTQYKTSRDREETPNEKKLQQERSEYRQQVPHIQKAMRYLGVKQTVASNMEADDLACIIVDRFMKKSPDGRVVMLTRDKDWIQIVQPGVTWKEIDGSRRVTFENFKEETGVDTPAQFVEVKALAGDSGDTIPGVGGVGEKGAVDFINAYGSFRNFLNMVILEKIIDFNKLPKKLRALVEDEEKALIFDRNLSLMDLRHPARPAIEGLSNVTDGANLETFRRFCELLLFNSILSQFDDFVACFPAGKLTTA